MAGRAETEGLIYPNGVRNGTRAAGLVVETNRLVVPKLEAATRLTAEAIRLPIKQIDPRFRVYEVDVRKLFEFGHSELGHPQDWRGAISDVAAAAPIKVIKGGIAPGSMAEVGFDTIYQPTNTTKIDERLSWLAEYFRGPFQLLVRRAAHDPTLTLGEGNASLNINYFKQEDLVGNQTVGYEQHYDRNKYTAILCGVTLGEHEGGELVLREGRVGKRAIGAELRIRPEAGKLIIFAGNEHPHEVSTITSNQARIMIPGDYFTAAHPESEILDPAADRAYGVGD